MSRDDVIDALVNIRHRRGLTQKDVAARIFVTPSTVNQFEHNRHSPSLARIMAYAQAVGAELRVEELQQSGNTVAKLSQLVQNSPADGIRLSPAAIA